MMAKYHLNQAKANLSSLVVAASQGEDVIITRYGKPIARLSGIENTNKKPKKRVLGFYPIEFRSDLLEPTAPEIIASFYDEGSQV